MEIFTLIQKNFLLFGIGLHQRPFNVRNLVTICIFCVAITSASAYFFYEAKTFPQYTDSIFLISVLILGLILFVITVSEMQRILRHIITGEKLINSSEFLYILDKWPNAFEVMHLFIFY